MAKSKSPVVKLINATIDETPEGRVIFRGHLDLGSLQNLQVDDYQRTLVEKNKGELKKALENGSTPDIELGMRGASFEEKQENDQTVLYLYDPVFIIDGLQRTSAAKEMLEKGDAKPHLGAVLHLETDKEWERERFRILNLERTKLSPNVLLRNMRDDLPAIGLVYYLSTATEHPVPKFVLNQRICWNQYMKKGEIMTATTLINAIAASQHHIASTISYGRFDQTAYALQKIMDVATPEVFGDNIITFFDVIDQAWNVRNIHYTQSTAYIRNTFLRSLGLVFSRHLNFWDGNRLVVDEQTIKRLSQFAVNDPTIGNLSSSGMQAAKILFNIMVEHIDHGRRRQGRLAPRVKQVTYADEDEGK